MNSNEILILMRNTFLWNLLPFDYTARIDDLSNGGTVQYTLYSNVVAMTRPYAHAHPDTR
jgi:hypothetical protein